MGRLCSMMLSNARMVKGVGELFGVRGYGGLALGRSGGFLHGLVLGVGGGRSAVRSEAGERIESRYDEVVFVTIAGNGANVGNAHVVS